MENSCPTPGEPYVQEVNWPTARSHCGKPVWRFDAPVLRSLNSVEPSEHGVFLAEMPGQRFTETKDLDGVSVTVAGVNDGQAIAIRPADREMLILGFRCKASSRPEPENESVKVERGAWAGDQWTAKGNVNPSVSRGKVEFRLTDPQAVRISW